MQFNNASGNYRFNNRGGFAPAPYANNRNGYNQYQQNQQVRKKSGCKSNKNDYGMYMYGWNKSRAGFMTFIASATQKAKTWTTGTGAKHTNWLVKVRIGRHKPELVSGIYNHTTGKLTIKDLGMVACAKTNYFGTFSRKN